MRSIIFLASVLLVRSATATGYYVSKNGNNTDGTTWATAWNELDRINWDSLSSGDVVYLDGGTDEMVYTTSLVTGSGGTEGSRLYIQRSDEAGHNGTVKLKHAEILHPYVTMDGREWGGIDLYTRMGRGLDVRPGSDGDFILKNTRLWGDFAQDSTRYWGSLMYIWSGDAFIYDCEFYQTNAEDQIKYLAADKKLVIEGCYFHGLKATWCADTAYSGGGYMRHADCVQFEKSAQGTELTARRNIFTNLGVDCFMAAYAAMAKLEFAYNVVTRVGDGLKIQSVEEAYIYNNVFDRCRDILLYTTPDDITIRNCIFNGTSWSGPVHVSGSPQYSLWDIGSTYWVAGMGNQQAEPLFMNEDDILGPDSLPFTADDGFHLQAGSPAIDSAAAVGYDTDITGTALDPSPDIGAYEYLTSGIGNGPEPRTSTPAALRRTVRHYRLDGRPVGKTFAGIHLVRNMEDGTVDKHLVLD